jgi:transposase-like protein
VEQRYDAVLAVIRDGLNVPEAAKKFGVSSQTLYRWMARYEAEGLEALAERSNRPHTVPHQMDSAIARRAVPKDVRPVVEQRADPTPTRVNPTRSGREVSRSRGYRTRTRCRTVDRRARNRRGHLPQERQVPRTMLRCLLA